MKKLTTFFLLLIFLINLFGINITHSYDESDEESVEKIETETFFVVTAYYSPLPGQDYYLRGNYEDEVILNGRGIAGASGKEVFAGMLAAPKTYSFGTQIYLEGVGVGQVEDRGGAIVSAGSRGYSYDRIDIWMGYGDEGLKRALAWGKRVVPGYIITDSGVEVSVDLDNFTQASDKSMANYTNDGTSSSSNYNMEIFTLYVTPNSGYYKVKKLQDLMYELGLIDEDQITGEYEDSKDELINYQYENGIIPSKKDEEAGYFGPKTRKKMSEDYTLLEEQKAIEAKLEKIHEIATKRVGIVMDYLGDLEMGDRNVRVKTLQKLLIILKSSDTLKASGTFGDKTELALKRYQLARGVIESFDEYGAGYFGPKTKAQLEADLIMLYEKKLVLANGL